MSQKIAESVSKRTAEMPADQNEIDGASDIVDTEFEITVRKIDFPIKPRGVLAE